jgi:hypothetical protein
MIKRIRGAESQSLQERIIEELTRKINRDQYDVHTNIGDHQYFHVDHVYPDIVVTYQGSDKVRAVLEVETAEAIPEEARQQWKFLAETGFLFYIIVRHEIRELVGNLATEWGNRPVVGTYRELPDGQVDVSLVR